MRKRKNRKQRLPLALVPVDAVQQGDRGVDATTTAGTATGTHGQFGDGADAVGGGFADLVIGHAIADADVHGGSVPTGPNGPVPIPP